MDQAYSALLEDLHQRGMLDETLVVWIGEFGRSPKINPSGGRDHWGHVFSSALAGGGIRGGTFSEARIDKELIPWTDEWNPKIFRQRSFIA